MRRAIATWDRFWFGPARPDALGVARCLYFAGLFAMVHREDDRGWSYLSRAAWEPIGIHRLLALPVASPEVLGVLDGVFVLALALACIGLFTRFAMLTAFAVGTYLLGLGSSFFKVDHGANLVVFTMLVLSLSRAGDAFSLDAWLARRRGVPAPAPSGEYTWPIRFVWLLVVAMYASAGISKLMVSGVDWALSDNLRNLLLRHHYSHAPPTRLGVWVAKSPELCRAFALGALGLELLCPLALFVPRLRAAIGLSLFAMQLGIYLMMGVLFPGALAPVVFWIPWNELLDRFPRTRGAATRDGSAAVAPGVATLDAEGRAESGADA